MFKRLLTIILTLTLFTLFIFAGVYTVKAEVCGGVSKVFSIFKVYAAVTCNLTDLPISPTISAVSAINSSDVWACGLQVDGLRVAVVQWRGITNGWTDKSPVANFNCKGIYAFQSGGNDLVWIVGDSGKVYYSSNSGASWSQKSNACWGTTNLKSVSSSDSSNNVWLAGASGKLCVTTDAGNTWSDRSSTWGSGVTINSVSVQSTTDVWVAGTSGNIWQCSANCSSGTPTWIQHSGTNRWSTADMYGVADYSSNRVVVVGDSGNVWEYDGSTWTQHSGTNRWATDNIRAISDKQSTSLWVGSTSTARNGLPVWEYKPARWQLTSGSETITNVGNVTYTRSVIIQNVCRDFSATDRPIKGITDSSGTSTSGCSVGGSYDPGTLFATVTVTWSGGSVTTSSYVTRWNNKVCSQTSWPTQDAGLSACLSPITTYASKTNINTNGGSFLNIDTPLLNASGTITPPHVITVLTGNNNTSRGPTYNSILWTGDNLNNNLVEFQILTSDDNASWLGPFGSDCTSATWYTPAQNTWTNLGCSAQFNNKKYYYYNLKLCQKTNCTDTGGVNPKVTGVYISYSP